MVFPYLEELNFGFNVVQNEAGLLWPVGQLRTLNYVVITGNPFAIAADLHLSTKKLEHALSLKQGQLVNESLNPLTFVKSRAGTSSYSNAGASRGKP